ncbi:MAG: hypothetical protein NTY68_00300, partial [Candidatus Micrarchaeota archaeon]|nr:hypothetical protein [Candidatus Micrarchaeota archaeon]
AQAALLDRLRKDNPGYSFTIKGLIPTSEDGNVGVPTIQILIRRSLDDVEEAKELEKKIKTSESEISSEIAGLAHHKINGAGIFINEQMYEHLKDPEAQAALLDRLRKDNPGYSFTIKGLIPTSEDGNVGVPTIQIGIKRDIDNIIPKRT